MIPTSADEWRVEFDADVEFSNGGGLQTQGFRLDIPGDTIDDEGLAELLVRHLGLLMVGKVIIRQKSFIQEPHKGSRGAETCRATRGVVDLSGPRTVSSVPLPTTLHGLVDLGTVLLRLGGSAAAEVDRHALVPFEVRGCAVLLHSGRPDAASLRLTTAAAEWLVEHGAAILGTDCGSLDPTADALHAARIPVLMGLEGLEGVPTGGARLHVVPTAHEGAEYSPVRVYAIAGID